MGAQFVFTLSTFLLLCCEGKVSRAVPQTHWFGREKHSTGQDENVDSVPAVNVTLIKDKTNLASEKHNASVSLTGIEDFLQDVLNRNPAESLNLQKLDDLKTIKMGSSLLKVGVTTGDSTRLEGVLRKALHGELIRVVIIGGSNSAGGGMDKDHGNLDGLYYRLLATWWNATIGQVTGSYMNEQLEAIGGTGSYFFAFCFDTFLRSSEYFDIAIVEASVNFREDFKAEPVEQLTRMLHTYKSRPAIMFVNLVGGLGLHPQTKKVINPNCSSLESFGQTEVVKRYNITSFSMSAFACPNKDGENIINDRNTEGLVSSDQKHIGFKAHARIALMMINYIKSIFDDVIHQYKEVYLKSSFSDEQQVILPPPIFINQSTKILENPQCWATITPDGTGDSIQKPTLAVKVLKNDGYSFYHNNYTEYMKSTQSKLRTDRQCGWGNGETGGSISFEIKVSPWKSDGNETRRSIIALIHTMFEGGDGRIWIDDNKDEAVRINSLVKPGGANELHTIARRVEPGTHTLTVEAPGKGMFILSGLLIGPPDFSHRRVI